MKITDVGQADQPPGVADDAHDHHGHMEAHKARRVCQESMPNIRRVTEARAHIPPGVTGDLSRGYVCRSKDTFEVSPRSVTYGGHLCKGDRIRRP